MNGGLIILRVASERRDAQNDVSATEDGAGAAQHFRRSGDSVLRRSSSSVATALQPSTQMVVSSWRPSSRCCWQHPEEGRGGTSRRDASCAQHQLRRSSISSVAAAAAGDGSVPRRWAVDGGSSFESVQRSWRSRKLSPHFPIKQYSTWKELGVTHPVSFFFT